MEQRILRLIDRIKGHLNETCGEGIKRIILYGSYARGQATKDSDVDVLVLTASSVKPSEVDASLNDLLYDMLLEKANSSRSSPFLRSSTRTIIPRLC